MTLAVTGGTGFVGQAVLDVLARKKVLARSLARSVPKESRPDVEWVQGSLDDPGALTQLVTGAEAVIHIAGLTTSHYPDELDRANAAGTLAVVEAARAAGVPRIVLVSSLAAREPALSAYGASKAKAETIVAASGMDWTTMRPPGVYGPRDRDYLDLFKAAKWGVVPMPPPGRSSLIHVHDLAELLLALVPGGEGVTGMVFEPDDGRVGGWSHRELARTIGWAVGSRPWVPHLSAGMLGRMSRLDRRLRGDKAKLTADRVSYMVHPDWVCDPARAVPAEIWTPRVPTRPGLKGTARWYREQGWL